MRCIEIITLRSLRKDTGQHVDELLRQVFKQKKLGLAASIRVYYHSTIETDLSIHIQHEMEAQQPGESPLGQQILYALKGLGFVNHSIWVELTAWNDHW